MIPSCATGLTVYILCLTVWPHDYYCLSRNIHFSLPLKRCCTLLRLLDQHIIHSCWCLQSYGSMWSARGDEIEAAGLVRNLSIALCITHSGLLSHEAASGCHCAGAKGRCRAFASIAPSRAPSELTAEAWYRSEASADKHRGGCFSTSPGFIWF